MSVINKMLRDLDSRQAADKMALQAENAGVDIAQGTSPAPASLGSGPRQGITHFGVVLIVFIVVMMAAGAWWYVQQKDLQRESGAPSSTLSLPAKAALPLNTLAPAASDSGSNASPLNAALADLSLKMDSSFHWTELPEKPIRLQAASPPAGQTRVAPASQIKERAPQEQPAKPVVALASVATPVAASTPPRRAPALDALAQAQSLWSAGSRDAAIELLSEALAVAERASLVAPASANNLLLSSLARELARMEMAEGRMSEALSMLTRLEPALSRVADVWAMRGNAAQRLGKHEESVAAYRSALKLRPNEPRWMLGAAVSLAAQGQTEGAAELAEKARAAGMLSPEVASYLRQLGVPLRDR